MNQDTSLQLEDDQLMGVVSIPQLLGSAHAETGRIRRYGGALAGRLVQIINLPPPDDEASGASYCDCGSSDKYITANLG
jgi:hypothetical protein